MERVGWILINTVKIGNFLTSLCFMLKIYVNTVGFITNANSHLCNFETLV